MNVQIGLATVNNINDDLSGKINLLSAIGTFLNDVRDDFGKLQVYRAESPIFLQVSMAGWDRTLEWERPFVVWTIWSGGHVHFRVINLQPF